ncbi:MAG TPA: inositol monophosphatase family protein [Solirubrobacteraceae bacterium]|jgi:myo-inositol-1(or 4)-monophosphatase|nr:inositol monophosphatase family protein [Solirubrobacteraceae bacterium]
MQPSEDGPVDSVPRPAAAPDWLALCRRIADGLERMLARYPTMRDRAVEVMRGEGGDMALVIDCAAEDVIFAELDALHTAGHRFTAVSEERGEVDYGGVGPAGLRVVIDPIDGSTNAKRCMTHHSVSIAVADGPTMADVVFGYVYDFGAREEWTAVRGGGATLNGVALPADVPEWRTPSGRLELLAIESVDPRWVADCAPRLLDTANRLRAIGSIAISLCQVAGGRVDGMLTLWRCRAVDAAAAQLIARETGALVAFPAFEDPLGAPLDLLPHSPVIAARSPRGLADLVGVPSSGG